MIEQNYADPVSSEKAIYQGAIPGMLRMLDPHTVFFDRDQFQQLQEMEQSISKGFGSIVSLLRRSQRIWGRIVTVSGVVAAFRRSAVFDVGGFSPNMPTEDIELTWKLQKRHYDVRYEPRAIVWMTVPRSWHALFRQRLRWAREQIDPVLDEAGRDRARFPLINFWAWHVKESREAAEREARIWLTVRGTLYPPRTVLYRVRGARYENEGHGHRVRIAGAVAASGDPPERLGHQQDVRLLLQDDLGVRGHVGLELAARVLDGDPHLERGDVVLLHAVGRDAVDLAFELPVPKTLHHDARRLVDVDLADVERVADVVSEVLQPLDRCGREGCGRLRVADVDADRAGHGGRRDPRRGRGLPRAPRGRAARHPPARDARRRRRSRSLRGPSRRSAPLFRRRTVPPRAGRHRSMPRRK